MKSMLDFVKASVVGGLLFFLPLVVTILLVKQALDFAAKALKPIAHLLPAYTIGRVAVADFLAAIVILALCFVAGLVIKTNMGRRFSGGLEGLAIRRVPGFALFRSAAHGLAGLEDEAGMTVALARIEEAWMLSFVIEKHASGLLTVFVPSAPTPAAGSVYYLTEDRVRHLNVPVRAAVTCIMQLGLGSKELIEGAPLAAKPKV